MSEIRSDELPLPQLAIELIHAIEVLEESKVTVLEARFTDTDADGSVVDSEVADIPTANLRSFLAETLKPKGHTLGKDELSLEDKTDGVCFRFCSQGHIHFTTSDDVLLEKTLKLWRKGGFKCFTRVNEEWVSRL
jgi:hypothetical protein